MAGAIREVSVYRGHNPRDFALLAFGGAGPMVASELASELGMTSVVISPYPGNLSALGLLVSPLKRDFVRTHIARLSAVAASDLRAIYRELEVRAVSEFEGDALSGHALVFSHSLDLRYVGQSFTVNVPIAHAAPDPAAATAAFHAAHDTTFGHAAPDEPVELVNLRLSATLAGIGLPIRPEAPCPGRLWPSETRTVWFRGGFLPCPVYARHDVPVGVELHGPLIVEEPGSSTVVWPNDRLRVDTHGNLRLEVGEK
jgi:N-methylhydantoinase A